MTDPAYNSPLGLAALVLAGMVAGGVNAVAGGGSLVSFPGLVGLGMPSLQANATNSVALWPGSAAGALGFRNRLDKTKHHLRQLILPTVLGSVAGAFLLVFTPGRVFDYLVPALILLATLLLAFQPQLKAWSVGEHRRFGIGTGAVIQFLVSVYGGYFGAGMGIMMLAAMGLYVDGDIHDHNAVKNILALVINFGASVVLVAKGLVILVPALALMAGTMVGGFAAARFSQRLDADKLRRVIVVYGVVMTGWFIWRIFA